MSTYYGLNKDFTLNDLTNKLPNSQLSFLKRLTENIGAETSPPIGGSRDIRKAYINMTSNKQDYNLNSDLIDYVSQSAASAYAASVSGSNNTTNVEIKNIYHYSAITLYRFYDPYSSINLLSQEFNFESFNTETIFYVLPLWTDILRAQMLNLNDKVRRSNFSYERVGNRLRIFPMPKIAMKLFIDYEIYPDPFGNDPSVSGISNFSNIPFMDIAYDKINSVGKDWIRHYCLALCMEMEGRIRRKFSKIPIPNDDITLDGGDLVREGIDKQKELEEKLREDLEKLSNTEMLKAEMEKAESIQRQLQQVPLFIYSF